MERGIAIVACLGFAAAAIAGPDPVRDVETGTDMHFDLKYMSYSYSGAMSGSGEVTDKDAPPGCAPKEPGTLNFVLDTGAMGLPFSVQIPVTGTRLSATGVRWTFDSIINECVTIYINGDPVNVLIRRVWGRLTADAAETPTFWDSICERSYNVRLDEVGGNDENYVNAEAYAFCIQNVFTRINFEGRNIDVVMFGGLGRLLPESVGLFRGLHVSGDLNSLKYSDNDHYVARPGLTLSTLEAPIQAIVTGNSPVMKPEELRFVLEAHASVTNVRQRIQLFNFATNLYEEVDVRMATTADSVVEVVISDDPGRFVGASGVVQARVMYQQAGPVLAFPWRAHIDQAVWIVP